MCIPYKPYIFGRGSRIAWRPDSIWLISGVKEAPRSRRLKPCIADYQNSLQVVSQVGQASHPKWDVQGTKMGRFFTNPFRMLADTHVHTYGHTEANKLHIALPYIPANTRERQGVAPNLEGKKGG